MKIAKLSLLAAAALLATNVQAGWEYNWLLGVSAGGAWHSGDDAVTFTVADGGVPFAESFTFANDNDDSHFIWGLLGGFQARCNALLLGLEVNVDWRDHGDDVGSIVLVDPVLGGATVATVSRDDHNYVVGITGRIGYAIAPYFMPYIRLGVDHRESNDFDFTVANDGTVTAPAFVVTSSSDNDGKWGFVGGIGAEFPIPVIAGLSLRAEWNYHSRHHDGDNVLAVLAPNGTTLYTVTGDDHHHEQTARASLVFNFPI